MNSSTTSADPWLLATYLPISLFSLKSTLATSSGGRTVLVPTPFAIKMALLDAAIRMRGIEQGRQIFPSLRDLRVALHVPDQLIVINSFGKVRRPWEHKGKGTEKEAAQMQAQARGIFPWTPTIAYREYVQFGGTLDFALAPLQTSAPDGNLAVITALLPCINYLGRRGGFIQLAALPTRAPSLPASYRVLTDKMTDDFGRDWTLQMLDDCDPSLTFEQANIYSGAKIVLGKQRVLRHVPLPLRLVQSSRSFSLYERIGE